jgi:predicted esterase
MERSIEHRKTFRYHLLNEGNNPKKILYVLHGYGQLSEYFIRKFRDLPSDLLIVAPEGMHRFYVQGSSGRVGASWMTKEARLVDIADTISYLSKLDEELSTEFDVSEKYLLGFSQGGATALRWNEQGTTHFDGLILWACVFPPDLNIKPEETTTMPSYFVIGDQDEYFNADAQSELISAYSEKNYRIKQFVGKHDIDSDTMNALMAELTIK